MISIYQQNFTKKHLIHGTFDIWIASSSFEFDCNEWNPLPNSRLFMKLIEIEKFLGDFVFSSKGSLNFLAFYM